MFFALSGLSQDTNTWKVLQPKSDSVMILDTVFGLVPNGTMGNVKVVKDKRIEKVSQDLSTGNKGKPLLKGYRIQVETSSTKANIDSQRVRLMDKYNVQTYMDYRAPNFRLRAGNFRTKLEAQKFQNEIAKDFPNTLIITDYIELPRLEE